MNYSVKDDLILVRDFFQITQNELSSFLNVDVNTIFRTETGITFPREEFLDKFYNFCFKKGLHLNLQKELFYKDDLQKGHYLLVHASKSGLEGEVSINKSRINNDFGNGFYCGDSFEKSISFVCHFPSSCIYFVDFDPKDLNELKFEVSTEWMLAIAYFRGKLDKYKDSIIIKKIIDKINKSDYIIAPIADNRMFQIIDTFINGEITDEQCKHCLSATNLGLQYVIKTNKALKNITLLEKCFVSADEKNFYKKEQIKNQKIGFDKVKLSRIEYHNIGKYIEELLS